MSGITLTGARKIKTKKHFQNWIIRSVLVILCSLYSMKKVNASIRKTANTLRMENQDIAGPKYKTSLKCGAQGL